MLRELSVQNLALIEDARVELEPGYCAWTGETGAGKSLLLTALGLVLGGKASADLVRQGCEEARASAVFELGDGAIRREVEATLGAEVEDGQLVVNRRVCATGRGQAHINGAPVAVATLRAIGSLLIDVHGQHEGRALLDPDRQRDWLDAHAGLAPLVDRYREARDGYETLRSRREALIASVALRARERDLLAFELDELAAARPRVGEHDELVREAHRLGNVGSLRDAASEGYALLYEADRSAQGLLRRVARRLEGLSESVPEFADAAADLERIADEAREIAYALRGLGQRLDDDPRRLEEAEARLATYRRLSSRFRCGPDDLASRLAETEDRLAGFDRDDADLASLDAPILAAWSELRGTATTLSEARKKAARAFGRSVQARLKALCLGEARLTVAVEAGVLGGMPGTTSPPISGVDRVEFLFTPNPGEEPRPLRKIASGGELSRVTLAVKTVLAEVDGVPTLVFDEIDTGVGGRLGSSLGRALADLATRRQVLCVTHLPQMASHANHQWVIRKTIEGGRTRTSISPLSDDDRVAELATMLRGDSAVESTRSEALAMLLEARSIR